MFIALNRNLLIFFFLLAISLYICMYTLKKEISLIIKYCDSIISDHQFEENIDSAEGCFGSVILIQL